MENVCTRKKMIKECTRNFNYVIVALVVDTFFVAFVFLFLLLLDLGNEVGGAYIS